MTLRRNVSEGRFADVLDGLIWCTLHDSVAQAQPPDHVWERIEQKVQRRVIGTVGQRVLSCVCGEAKQVLWRQVQRQSRAYEGRMGQVRPMIFSAWEGRVPLSLVCIIEQQMPILRLGWIT